MDRRTVFFRGRVQGVGFRANARAIASRHALTGWVRNEPNGGVQMQVQGEPGEIDRCLDEIARSMSRNITGVDQAGVPVLAGEVTFEIRY